MSNIHDSRDRLTWLISSPQEMQKNSSITTIKQEIQLRKTPTHRNPHNIHAMYINKVKHWLEIKVRDAKGFPQFHNSLKLNCMVSNQKQNVLDTPDIFCILLSNLPAQTLVRRNTAVWEVPKLDDFT